jgi:predicted amidohydrolase
MGPIASTYITCYIPAEERVIRVAAIQFDPTLGAVDGNLTSIETLMARAAAADADLVVFPECAVTGYVYESLEEAMSVAQPIPGPVASSIGEMTAQHGLYAVVGMLERRESLCFNAALLAGPEGPIGVYRKTHTLCLGVDRFTTPGDIPYQVHHLPIGRVGVLICYDLRFPEPARVLALQGAQIICLPTNWPVSSTVQPDVFTRARAAENRVFVVAADRVGRERDAHFLGRSQIVEPSGTVLAEAPMEGEEILVHDIDPCEADRKHLIVEPGRHEMHATADRRPDLYEPLLS